MALLPMLELPHDAPTPFVRPGMLSWTVAPQVPVSVPPTTLVTSDAPRIVHMTRPNTERLSETASEPKIIR